MTLNRGNVKEIIDKACEPIYMRTENIERITKAVYSAIKEDRKQAVREFAEKLETKAQTLQGDGFDEYNEGFDRGVKETLYLINELLAEVIEK